MADLPSAELVAALARWRGETLSPERAAEVAADLARIVGHARAAAAGNDFNAEPGRWPLALARLARGEVEPE